MFLVFFLTLKLLTWCRLSFYLFIFFFLIFYLFFFSIAYSGWGESFTNISCFSYHTFTSFVKSRKNYPHISNLNDENLVLSNNRITLTTQEVILVLDQFSSYDSLCLSNGFLTHSDSGFESYQPALRKFHSQVLNLPTVNFQCWVGEYSTVVPKIPWNDDPHGRLSSI